MSETLHFLIPDDLGKQPNDSDFFFYDNQNGGHLTIFVSMDLYDQLAKDGIGREIIETEVNNLISSLQDGGMIGSVNEGVRLIPIENSPTINGVINLGSIN